MSIQQVVTKLSGFDKTVAEINNRNKNEKFVESKRRLITLCYILDFTSSELF
jgi:hypothetical protein